MRTLGDERLDPCSAGVVKYVPTVARDGGVWDFGDMLLYLSFGLEQRRTVLLNIQGFLSRVELLVPYNGLDVCATRSAACMTVLL